MENLMTTRLHAELPDSEVIQRVLGGEINLYEILMRKNNQILYRVLRGYLKDRNDVEDTMQDAYIIAYQKLHQFKGVSGFSTWLVRIGINEALRRIRKEKHNWSFYHNDELSEEHVIHDHTTPEMKIVKSELNSSIEKAIDDLPETLRPVFILREVEGMNVEKTAECLGLTPENVKVRFHRAKKLLRDYLAGMADVGEVFAYGSHHCDRMVENVLSRIKEMETGKKG